MDRNNLANRSVIVSIPLILYPDIKKRVKQYSKEKALEILAKYTTLYTDAPQIDLNINTDDENVKAILAKHGIQNAKN